MFKFYENPQECNFLYHSEIVNYINNASTDAGLNEFVGGHPTAAAPLLAIQSQPVATTVEIFACTQTATPLLMSQSYAVAGTVENDAHPKAAAPSVITQSNIVAVPAMEKKNMKASQSKELKKEWKHEMKNDRHVKEGNVELATDGMSIYCGFCKKTSQMKRAFNLDNWSLHVKSESHTSRVAASDNFNAKVKAGRQM